MKITKNQLKQIIKEELSAILGEEELNELVASGSDEHFSAMFSEYGTNDKESACLAARAKLEKLGASTTLDLHSLRPGEEEQTFQQVQNDIRHLCGE
tara:strand:- start:288 stop:578 length:291 start_codon:yes stop_codon:yes gene_type:complete